MSLSSVPCACNSVALLKIFTGIVRFVGDHPSRLEDGESQRSCSVKRLALDKGPAARSMAGNTQGKHPNSPKRVWCLCLLLAVSFRHHRCRACLRPSRLRHSYRCRRRSTTTSSLLNNSLIVFTLRSRRFGSGLGVASIIRFRIIRSVVRWSTTSGMKCARGLKHSEQRHESISWWTRLDSNQEPADYEPDALTVELRVRRRRYTLILYFFCSTSLNFRKPRSPAARSGWT